MARLVNFRSLMAESLEKNDAIGFQKLMKAKLNESYMQHQQEIFALAEQDDNDEGAVVASLEATAKHFGGYKNEYNEGVLVVTVPTKKAAQDFATALDDDGNVDSYEVDASFEDPTEKGSETSLDDQGPDEDLEYTFTIYLNTETVQFEAYTHEEEMEDEEEDDEEEDDEEMEETCKKHKMKESYEHIEAKTWLFEVEKVVTCDGNTKTTTIICPVGTRWDEKEQRCKKVTVSENRKRFHKARLLAEQAKQEIEEAKDVEQGTTRTFKKIVK